MDWTLVPQQLNTAEAMSNQKLTEIDSSIRRDERENALRRDSIGARWRQWFSQSRALSRSACYRITDAEAERSLGLPNTLRQPALKLARCRCMQAMIRSRSGISDAQSRKTSPVQSRR
ncbi:hypothetical protein BRAS3843_2210002 [Bradyrhizobium sp. STM 3843]|nr:hypothetical protein BRAS3843_2210002 [Bradyrhizobium sp. STM 3843]